MSELDAYEDSDIKILLQLHNMAAVDPRKAVEAKDIAKILMMKVEELTSRLIDLAKRGYVVSLQDEVGNRRFHLTGLGVIKVASLFS
jgi:DNA-binding MarR family transcriptional regulator